MQCIHMFCVVQYLSETFSTRQSLSQALQTELPWWDVYHVMQICRDDYPQPVCISLWVLFELSIVALELTMVWTLVYCLESICCIEGVKDESYI
jgi:Mn2+/Fe2+ NRAMP family transporter